MEASRTYSLIESIVLPTNGIYGVAEPLLFSLNFNNNVFVGQTPPQLPVEIGYRMRHAEYVGGAGTNILNFALNNTPGDLDLDGISLGVVDSITGLRDFDFASSVLDVWGNQVADFIPFINTKNILVDAKGPEIVSYSDLMLQHNGIEPQVVLEINFDQDVYVSGVPLVPVQFGASPAFLTYKFGSGSKSLVFVATVPDSMGTVDLGFRKMTGQVIYLPEGVNIKDQLGNSIEFLGSNYNEILIEDGNRVVVMGAHYEYLETIKREALDQYMEDQKAWYLNGAVIDSKKPTEPSNIKSYLRDYEIPQFTPAANDVDLYRIGFRSSIPEQNRFVTAYGIAGIPKTSSE